MKKIILSSVVLAALVFSGCGGGGSDDEGTGSGVGAGANADAGNDGSTTGAGNEGSVGNSAPAFDASAAEKVRAVDGKDWIKVITQVDDDLATEDINETLTTFTRVKWDAAKQFCENITLDNASWRLPTKAELEGIIKDGKVDENVIPVNVKVPAMENKLLGVAPVWGDTYVDEAGQAFDDKAFIYYNNNVTTYEKSKTAFVTCTHD